ncbi:MAG: hypothetical protein V3V99_08540 [candidate division Zixibacteria bacterium]
MKNTISILVLAVVLASMSFAQIPQIINYQGRLTDTGGEPVPDGPYLINFVLYSGEASDDTLWFSGQQSIQVTDGLFSYQLGSNNPLPSDFFGPGSEPFLGVTIESDPEISPRTRITSAAFSWHSHTSDTAGVARVATLAQDLSCYHCVSTADIDDGCINAAKIAPGAVNSDKIQDGTIRFGDIGTNGAAEGEVMKMVYGNWTAAADETSSGSGSGDITAVYPGSGLSGGGETGDVTLSITPYGITSSHLAGSSVDGGKILDFSVTGNDIAGNSVETGHIQNNTILFNDIASNGAAEGEVMKMVGGNWIAAADETGSGGGGDITAVIASTGLDGGGVSGDVMLSIADLGVGNLQLAQNSVSAAKMQNNSVWSDHIMDNEVGTAELDDNAVTGSKIANGAVTHNKIASSSINNYHITNGEVLTEKLEYGAVTSAKILDGTITSADLAEGAVNMSNIAQSGATESQAITWSESAENWLPNTVGDITSVTTPTLGGLLGGGESGDIALWIGLDAITTGLIKDGAIINDDIWSSADIDPTKIRGTAVNISEAQTISGAKTFEDLNISTTTRRLAISSAAFVPGSSFHTYYRATSYLRLTATGANDFFAQVSLPDGATVTQVKVTYYDNDANYNGYIQLVKTYMASGGEIIMASALTTGTPGYTTVTDGSIVSETVSNDGYNYSLKADFGYSSNPVNMRLYGAEIVYTIARPLP